MMKEEMYKEILSKKHQELNEKIIKNDYDLLNFDVQALSRELDKLIVEYSHFFDK